MCNPNPFQLRTASGMFVVFDQISHEMMETYPFHRWLYEDYVPHSWFKYKLILHIATYLLSHIKLWVWLTSDVS
jgi:hypothetical protein